ncbi:MAG: galactose-1-phosphate uridylyltransferase, partial [Clostridia bacterium]|nr:galactose-1-phosphate uridylyltransferase [Clostridia bacterium]
PIVGGSILSHDHMQGGRHTFPMERAAIAQKVSFRGYDTVQCGIVDWPLSVIRLSGTDRDAMIDLADKILKTWRAYSDPERTIFAETDGEPHNTITPIARMRDGAFELDLVLRNNLTTPEHPLGLYHPHEELHHIKKENIGLIEVMGLAVLPARLKAEMAQTADAILAGRDLRADPVLEKHADWIDELRTRYTFTKENVNRILFDEIGAVFVRVLEDAGVYPATPEGREGMLRFVDAVNA